ncbi:MAG: proline racemase family protein [Nitrospiraceae bacterium]
MERITTVDAHVAGEPLRVVVSGFPEPAGSTMLERRRDAAERYDHLRKVLVWEPRGHADMYGCVLTTPITAGAHRGVLFFHNSGFSTMCGHGIIGLVTVALETGMVPISSNSPTNVLLDTPSGLVSTWASVQDGRVRHVVFRNVPAFALSMDEIVEVPEVGKVRYDLAFGGAFYAICRAEELGVPLVPAESRRLTDVGMAIKRTIVGQREIRHPIEPELGFLYGTIFVGPPQAPGASSRNVCVFADGAVDRSPTGTGVSARLALSYARGELKLGETCVVESIIGSRFTGRIAELTELGGCRAVIPEIEGAAYLTGRHEFLVDPEDPLREGFFLR